MAKARTMWKKNPISPAIKRRPLKKNKNKSSFQVLVVF
jgi:hypothetical protein